MEDADWKQTAKKLSDDIVSIKKSGNQSRSFWSPIVPQQPMTGEELLSAEVKLVR